ncbi:hypothetical protein FA13DRAFT_1704340 [Coprinellus micaceus]|uniref:Uncharacterized protein n=1 Tax=Coprinellus micaceus TaxID=71717 RepID=A0A4Y7TWN7_COPMI|nr:hypothetical protein FA13DRAFT_1704340 [Coprinellus micaceus]
MSIPQNNLPIAFAKGKSPVPDEFQVPTAPTTPLKGEATTAVGCPRPLRRATAAPFPLDLSGTVFFGVAGGMGFEDDTVDDSSLANAQADYVGDLTLSRMSPVSDGPVDISPNIFSALEFDDEYFRACNFISIQSHYPRAL